MHGLISSKHETFFLLHIIPLLILHIHGKYFQKKFCPASSIWFLPCVWPKNVIKKKKISKSKSRYSSQSSTRKSSEVDSDTKDVTEEDNANQYQMMTNNGGTTAGNSGSASFRRSKSANKIAMGLARSLKKVSVSGSVHGRNVIIVDDMIDTGITLKNAVEVKYLLK